MMTDRSEPALRAGRPRGGGRRFARTAWRIVRRLLILYLVVVLIMMFLERSLVYFPWRYPRGEWNTPGLDVEDAWFESADGTKIHGWYVGVEDAPAAVLFCHGNAGNITNRYEPLCQLRDRVGVSVLIFDYRGYGRSEGRPDEQGLLADARAARTWLAQREGIAEADVVLLGRSLGGAVAVDLATDGARGLVLESTFTSMPDVAAYHYPWLPVRWVMRTRFDSLAKIAGYHGPLLQSHGDADTTVPIRFGRRLFEAANGPKQFITFPGIDHNDFQPVSYYDRLREFVEGLPAR